MTYTHRKWDFAELNHDGDLLRSIRESAAISTTAALSLPDVESKMVPLPAMIGADERQGQHIGQAGTGAPIPQKILVGHPVLA